MKNFVKCAKIVAILSLLFSVSIGFADNESCSENCREYDCKSGFWDNCIMSGIDIGVDFLWWKPCVDDLDYAADAVTETNFKYKHVCPGWEPGVRVAISKSDIFCEWDLNFSWTYIRSTDSSSVSRDDGIFANLLLISDPPVLYEGFYDYAKGSWEIDYHEWEALLSNDIPFGKCHHFIPFFGAAGLFLDQKLKAKYIGAETIINFEGNGKWTSDYWGIGLRAGSAYSCNFSDCMSFFFTVSGTALIGEFDSKLHSTLMFDDELSELTLNDEDCCHMVSGYHLGVGYNFERSYCGIDFTFRLGYEIVDWIEIPNQENFVGGPDSSHYHGSSSSTRALGFHGFAAGLAFNF